MSRRADERMGGRESSEDYLEAILVIRRLRGSCRNVDIAERLGRSKPSVTKALWIGNTYLDGFDRISPAFLNSTGLM